LSPLFGRHDNDPGQDLARPADMGPQIEAVANRVAALPLEQFASQVMTQFLKADYEPGGGAIAAGDVADGLMPPHNWPKMGDDVPPAQVVLEDLCAEALQLLEHAQLIRPDFSYQGALAGFGYVTTRRGRLAIQQNAVDQALASAAAQA
jgi:hypothetical protein